MRDWKRERRWDREDEIEKERERKWKREWVREREKKYTSINLSIIQKYRSLLTGVTYANVSPGKFFISRLVSQ